MKTMNTTKQNTGETDRCYFARCRTKEFLFAIPCRKCGDSYETDGVNDNGLCFECEDANVESDCL